MEGVRTGPLLAVPDWKRLGSLDKEYSTPIAQTYPRGMLARDVHETWREHTRGKCWQAMFTTHGANIPWKGPQELLTKHGATNARSKCSQEMSTKHGATNAHREGPQEMFTTHGAKYTHRKGSQDMPTEHCANIPTRNVGEKCL